MADPKSEGAEQWVVRQIEQHGLTRIALILFFFSALIGGIFWWRGRNLALRSASLDNRKKENDLLADLTGSRNKFRSVEETFKLSLLAMRDAIDEFKAKKIEE